jgi:hypothetical protein
VLPNTVIPVCCICRSRGMKVVYAIQNTMSECPIYP